MLLGQMLVAAGVITPHELRVALRYQDDHFDLTLGAVIIRLGFASEEQVERAVMGHGLMQSSHKRIDMEALLALVDHITDRQREISEALELVAQLIANTPG